MTNGPDSNGDTATQIARLNERGYSQQGEIKTLRNQVAALESVLLERTGIRNWLPTAAIIAGGAVWIFIFGLKPIEDKNAANEVASIARDLKQQTQLEFIRDSDYAQRALLFKEVKDQIDYVRDFAAAERLMIWELTLDNDTKVMEAQHDLDIQRDARIDNLEDIHFRE